MLISKFVSVLLSVLQLVLIVPAQFPNMIAMHQNNVQQLQSFVMQNLQNTLQDMNNMVTGFSGYPGMVIKSNYQPQNIRSNNLYTTIVQGSNMKITYPNGVSWSNFPNMQLHIGTIDSMPPTPEYDNRITFNRPPSFVQGDLYHGLPKPPVFVTNLLKNKPPPYTTTPINTFTPEYPTPAPVENEENNGNDDKINDNDQAYDIDVRFQ